MVSLNADKSQWLGSVEDSYVPASSRLSSLTLQPPNALLPPFGSHLGEIDYSARQLR